jgi:hypothetical protein
VVVLNPAAALASEPFMSMPFCPLMIMYGVLLRSSPEILSPLWCGTHVLAVADGVVMLSPSMTMPPMASLDDSAATAG